LDWSVGIVNEVGSGSTFTVADVGGASGIEMVAAYKETHRE
jgi:hypothetical protein